MSPERMVRALAHIAKAKESLDVAMSDAPHLSLGTVRGCMSVVEAMLEASLSTRLVRLQDRSAK